MFSFFRAKPQSQLTPVLPNLDESFYPLLWQQQSFGSVTALLLNAVQSLSNPQDLYHSQGRNKPQGQDKSQQLASDYDPQMSTDVEAIQTEQNTLQQQLASTQKQFSVRLLDNKVYQDWINFTVFGRYIQRSFSAFYQQTEDVFNANMPELLRHELMRHTQRLPKGQVLLLAGKLPSSVRSEKLLLTTLNPFKAIEDALNQNSSQLKKTKSRNAVNGLPVINLITARSDQVKAFAIKHNKRTSEGVRNEVMILDFSYLTLMKEETFKNEAQSEFSFLIRHYTIG